MDGLTKEQLLQYKADLESALQSIENEYQQTIGALNFCEVLLQGLEQAEPEKELEK